MPPKGGKTSANLHIIYLREFKSDSNKDIATHYQQFSSKRPIQIQAIIRQWQKVPWNFRWIETEANEFRQG